MKETNLEAKPKKVKKKGFLKKLLLFLTIIILLIVFIIFIKNVIRKYQNKKFVENLNAIKQEEIMNVVVEINPSIAFVVKNDTIIDSYCLNEDCVNLLDKMNINYNDNINNQRLDKTIELLYNNAKNYGYDTSNGISISSSNLQVEALVKNIKDASFDYITIEEEKEILQEFPEKTESVSISKKEYNKKLLEELKKDSEYDKTYYCYIENDEVKCYMKDFMKEIMDEFGSESLVSKIGQITIAYDRFVKLLNKFNFSYSFTFDEDGEPNKDISLNDGRTYGYGDMASCPIMDCNNNVLQTIEARYVLMPNDQDIKALTGLNDAIIYIPFTKVNLLTKTYEKKDMIVVDRTDCNSKVYYGIE